MGNTVAVPALRRSGGVTGARGRVVLSDGTVQEYEEPLTVAELMLEHPQQMVMELPVKVKGKGKGKDGKVRERRKASPLPADQKLEVSKVYVMIPIRRGKPAAATSSLMSSEEARRILMKANSFLKSSGGATGFLPLLGRMCAERRSKKKLNYGELRGEDHEETNKTNTAEDQDHDDHDRYCFSSEILMRMEEERPEFLSRQISGKGWKPSLDTITEKNVHTKVRHWLF